MQTKNAFPVAATLLHAQKHRFQGFLSASTGLSPKNPPAASAHCIMALHKTSPRRKLPCRRRHPPAWTRGSSPDWGGDHGVAAVTVPSSSSRCFPPRYLACSVPRPPLADGCFLYLSSLLPLTSPDLPCSRRISNGLCICVPICIIIGFRAHAPYLMAWQ
jgi:hypothetical protein